MRNIIAPIAMALILSGLFCVPSSACSVCRCGDNGFQFSELSLMPASGRADSHFRITIGNSYSTKSNALGADEGVGDEKQREIRPSLKASYKILDNVSLSAELPVGFKRLDVHSTDGEEIVKTSGFGDLEFTGSYISNLFTGINSMISYGISVAMKVPSGRNNLQSDGERQDEHLQTGTGSYDYTIGGGLVGAKFQNMFFTSIYYRHNGTNKYEYHYGDAVLFNLGLQHAVNSWMSGDIQFNARDAKVDSDNGHEVENTGGWMGYLTPGLHLALGNMASFSASVQLPVWQDLKGDQSEKAVFLSGLTVGIR